MTRRARGRTAVILVSCLAVALAGYGVFRLVTSSWHESERPLPQADATAIPAGSAPPPTDQSAAPLPPPPALPGVAPAAPGAGPEAVPDGAAGIEHAGTAASAADAADGTTEHGPVTFEAPPKAGTSAEPAAVRSKEGSPVAAAPHVRGARPHGVPSATAGSGHSAAPPSRAPAASAPPVPQTAAAVPPPAAPVDDRWAQMSADLSRCTREDFINRVICSQRVRFRYCDGYWGKVKQCPVSPSTEAVR